MYSRQTALVLALFCLILIAGCLQKMNNGSNLFEQQYRDSLSRVAISTPEDLEECRPGTCICMLCKNNTPIFPSKINYIGGSCSFKKECNEEELAKINFDNSAGVSVKPLLFMLGQGPTFGDFGSASAYCGNGLTMAVQWLVGSKDVPYTLPDPKRSMCFLSKGTIPIYLLYSNGTNINVSRAGRIAEILGTEGKNYYNGLLHKDSPQGQVGPVIIVTEMNFDKSQASEVAEQVLAIDRVCNPNRGR
jgi:hypothetical protein